MYKSNNNNGPSTVPCGIPESTWVQVECFSPTTTHWLLCFRKLLIHSSVLPFIPYKCVNLYRSLLCGTVSKRPRWPCQLCCFISIFALGLVVVLLSHYHQIMIFIVVFGCLIIYTAWTITHGMRDSIEITCLVTRFLCDVLFKVHIMTS